MSDSESVRTIRLNIVVDDNGNIQRVESFKKTVDDLVEKSHKVGEGAGGQFKKLGEEIAGAVPGGKQILSVFEEIGTKGALGIAGAALAIGEMVKSIVDATFETAEWAHQMQNMSRTTGIATNDLQTLNSFAERMGIGNGELANAIGQLTRRINDPSGGGGARDALIALGVDVDKLRTESNPMEVFITAAQAAGQLTDAGEKARVSMEFFGRSGLAIRGALTPAIRETIEELQKTNKSVAPETLARFEDLDNKTKELASSWRVLKTEALLPVVGVLDAMIEKSSRLANEGILGLLVPGANKTGQFIGKKTLTVGDAAGAGGGGEMPTSLSLDPEKLGMGTAGSIKLIEFENAMRNITLQGVEPLDREARQLIGTLRDYGAEEATIILQLERKGLSTEKTKEKIKALTEEQKAAKEETAIWAEGLKAAAVAENEGYAQTVALAKAAHEIKLKMIEDEGHGPDREKKQKDIEDRAYAITRESLEIEVGRKLLEIHQNNLVARLDLDSKFFHDETLAAKMNLDAQLQLELTIFDKGFKPMLDASAKEWKAYQEARTEVVAIQTQKRRQLEVDALDAVLHKEVELAEKEREARIKMGLPVEADYGGFVPGTGITRKGNSPEIQKIVDEMSPGLAESSEAIRNGKNNGASEATMANLRATQASQLERLTIAVMNAGNTYDQATPKVGALGDAAGQAADEEKRKLEITTRPRDGRGGGGGSHGIAFVGNGAWDPSQDPSVPHFAPGPGPWTLGPASMRSLPMSITINAQQSVFDSQDTINNLAQRVGKQLGQRMSGNAGMF